MPPNGADLASLSSLDDRVRGRLYEFVSGRAEPVGRDEAAAAVGIGRALAVYHLDKLVESGLLTVTYQRLGGRSGPGAGRPAKLYATSDREFAVSVPPRDYELAAQLLARAVEAASRPARAALQAAARQCGTELGRRHQAGAAGDSGPRQDSARQDSPRQDGTRQDGTRQDSPRQDSPRQDGRARRAAEAALREHGFEPWHDQAGAIRLRNCPFHQLAAEYPGLTCAMNLALVEGIAAGAGATGLSPALDPAPGRCCVVIGAGKPTG